MSPCSSGFVLLAVESAPSRPASSTLPDAAHPNEKRYENVHQVAGRGQLSAAVAELHSTATSSRFPRCPDLRGRGQIATDTAINATASDLSVPLSAIADASGFSYEGVTCIQKARAALHDGAATLATDASASQALITDYFKPCAVGEECAGTDVVRVISLTTLPRGDGSTPTSTTDCYSSVPVDFGSTSAHGDSNEDGEGTIARFTAGDCNDNATEARLEGHSPPALSYHYHTAIRDTVTGEQISLLKSVFDAACAAAIETQERGCCSPIALAISSARNNSQDEAARAQYTLLPPPACDLIAAAGGAVSPPLLAKYLATGTDEVVGSSIQSITAAAPACGDSGGPRKEDGRGDERLPDSSTLWSQLYGTVANAAFVMPERSSTGRDVSASSSSHGKRTEERLATLNDDIADADDHLESSAALWEQVYSIPAPTIAADETCGGEKGDLLSRLTGVTHGNSSDATPVSSGVTDELSLQPAPSPVDTSPNLNSFPRLAEPAAQSSSAAAPSYASEVRPVAPSSSSPSSLLRHRETKGVHERRTSRGGATLRDGAPDGNHHCSLDTWTLRGSSNRDHRSSSAASSPAVHAPALHFPLLSTGRASLGRTSGDDTMALSVRELDAALDQEYQLLGPQGLMMRDSDEKRSGCRGSVRLNSRSSRRHSLMPEGELTFFSTTSSTITTAAVACTDCGREYIDGRSTLIMSATDGAIAAKGPTAFFAAFSDSDRPRSPVQQSSPSSAAELSVDNYVGEQRFSVDDDKAVGGHVAHITAATTTTSRARSRHSSPALPASACDDQQSESRLNVLSKWARCKSARMGDVALGQIAESWRY